MTEEFVINYPNPNAETIFNVNINGKSEWVMKITRKGIFFNREKFPDATRDEFANSIISILETHLAVKFKKRIS